MTAGPSGSDAALGDAGVLHVIGSLTAGGAERFAVELACALKRRGINVSLFALGAGHDAVGAEMRKNLRGADVEYAVGPNPKVGLMALAAYVRRLYALRPAIVHLHTENTELAHYLARLVYRERHDIVRTMHTTVPSTQWQHVRALRYNRAAVSIACGPAVHERCAHQVTGTVLMVPNGVNYEWPIQDVQGKKRAKQVRGWFDDKTEFVTVGALRGAAPESAAKAHDVLLRAWRAAAMTARGARLHVIGDGNLRAQLEHIAAGDDGIVFHGVQSPVFPWLLAADRFVMPSRYEGLPIAGIEALGTGLPCLFSDIAPLRELQTSYATHVKVDDEDRLAEALVASLQPVPFPPRSEVEQQRVRYGLDAAVERYEEIYRNLLGDAASSSIATPAS